MIAAIGVFVSLLLEGEQRQTQIESQRAAAIELAHELQDTSEVLTRFAQTYTATGDAKFERCYRMVISVRDGKLPHPKDHPFAIWDMAVAGIEPMDSNGELYSIEQRLNQLGLPDLERIKLMEVKAASDLLISLEQKAMNGVKELYRDSEGRDARVEQTDSLPLRDLLYGDEYHRLKAKVTQPIDQFVHLLDRRTGYELNAVRQRIQTVAHVISLLVVVTIGFLVYVFLFLNRRIVRPLARLERSVQTIGEGEGRAIDVPSQDEIGSLATTFNSMAHSITELLHSRNTVLDNALVGMAQMVKGRFTWVNEHMAQMFGYRQEAMIGHSAGFLYADPGDYRRVRSEVAAAMLRREFYQGEIRFQCNDGSALWCLISGKAIDPDEPAKGVIYIVVDITRLKELQEELAESKRAAEEANRAKSIFLANMSHELRTPLNSILGFSESLGRDQEVTVSQRDKLAIINRSGEHLLTMINDVLDLSKIEAGQVELEPSTFDLMAMLEDIAWMFEMRANNVGLRFERRLGPMLPRYIEADAGKLRQILINLLGNAVKYTAEGGVMLRAQTRPVTNDPSQVVLHLEVEDTGPGIPLDQQERIFDPFVQVARSTSATKGTGLGLAITRSFVKLMGGRVGVDAGTEKGALFRVALPVSLADRVEDNHIERIWPTVLGLEPGQPDWRILVVEDSPENRVLLGGLLMGVGFDIREAENGREAVDLFRQWRPHFIWMDMRMPVMDGYQATEEIRSLPGGGEVKIVAITASAFMEQRGSILDAGCDDVLLKPYQAHEIFNMMARQLGVRYCYEEVAESRGTETVATTALDLSGLPEELRALLSEAVRRLDIESMAQVIERIGTVDRSTAAQLKQLADGYRFKRI